MTKRKSTNTNEKNIEQEINNRSDESDNTSGSDARPVKIAKLDETEELAKTSKKSKDVSPQPVDTPTPTNMKMPESLFFEKREGAIKFASWNVNGLNSALKKVERVLSLA
jgi:hypothetical protein